MTDQNLNWLIGLGISNLGVVITIGTVILKRHAEFQVMKHMLGKIEQVLVELRAYQQKAEKDINEAHAMIRELKARHGKAQD